MSTAHCILYDGCCGCVQLYCCSCIDKGDRCLAVSVRGVGARGAAYSFTN